MPQIDDLLIINIIKSMYSNGYQTSFLHSRSKVEHSYDSHNHTFLSNAHQKHPDSLLILKVDLLAKKLRQKKPASAVGSKFGHSTLEYSRLSNLRQTKSPEAIRQSTQYDWQQSDLKIRREQAVVDNQIELLEERTIDTHDKCKQLKQYFQIHTGQIYGSIGQLQQIIKDVHERTICCSPLRKEFRIYTDLFQSFKKENQSPLRKVNARKPTVTSAGKDASLLLSFKKNMQEEEGYMTLKYSEESGIKEPSDTLVEGWQSFQKENRGRLRRKAQQFKQAKDSGIIPEQMQEQFCQMVKEQVSSHLNALKSDLNSSAAESSQVILKLQNLLDEIVQQIAEQKVEREHEWKALKKGQNEQMDLMSSSLTQLKHQTVEYQLDIESKIRQLQEQFMDRLSTQISERKLQEKLMIKMMLDVVQFLK